MVVVMTMTRAAMHLVAWYYINARPLDQLCNTAPSSCLLLVSVGKVGTNCAANSLMMIHACLSLCLLARV